VRFWREGGREGGKGYVYVVGWECCVWEVGTWGNATGIVRS
jgi:hypothetical protein